MVVWETLKSCSFPNRDDAWVFRVYRSDRLVRPPVRTCSGSKSILSFPPPPGAAREYPRQGRAVAEEPAPLRSGRGARLLAGSRARHRNSPVIVGVAGLKGAVPGQARLLD